MNSLLAIVDLAKRWNYTKAGVHKLARKVDFPLPFVKVCNDRISLYTLADIEVYEKDKPWLFDIDVKAQRVRGYYRAITRGHDDKLE